MSKDAFNKVKAVLEPYIVVSSEIKGVPDKRLPEMMFKLLKDNGLYEAFEKDPDGTLRKQGIEPKAMDVKMFSSLAKMLRSRLAGQGSEPVWPGASIQKKEKNQGQDKNFDKSESWITIYESYYKVYKTKGTSSNKETSESMQTDKGFQERGVDTLSDSLLKYQINMLFFPSQPLVTPELLEKIKTALGEGNND
jgi:hypothetical protein